MGISSFRLFKQAMIKCNLKGTKNKDCSFKKNTIRPSLNSHIRAGNTNEWERLVRTRKLGWAKLSTNKATTESRRKWLADCDSNWGTPSTDPNLTQRYFPAQHMRTHQVPQLE